MCILYHLFPCIPSFNCIWNPLWGTRAEWNCMNSSFPLPIIGCGTFDPHILPPSEGASLLLPSRISNQSYLKTISMQRIFCLKTGQNQMYKLKSWTLYYFHLTCMYHLDIDQKTWTPMKWSVPLEYLPSKRNPHLLDMHRGNLGMRWCYWPHWYL